MRTAEEYINSSLKKHFPSVFFAKSISDAMIEVITQAQKDAYNQALEEAAMCATTRTNDESTCIVVDKQSILRLKK